MESGGELSAERVNDDAERDPPSSVPDTMANAVPDTDSDSDSDSDAFDSESFIKRFDARNKDRNWDRDEDKDGDMDGDKSDADEYEDQDFEGQGEDYVDPGYDLDFSKEGARDISDLMESEPAAYYCPGGLHPVNIDEVLNGRYKIVHKLGSGGFATIWLAHVMDEERYVTVKILRADARSNELDFFKYLQDRGANHPCIISLQDAFTVSGPHGLHQCLVLDFIGPTLKTAHISSNKVPVYVSRRAARQLVEGIAHLHSLGICHGDLTNANVLYEMKNINLWSLKKVYKRLGKVYTERVLLQSGLIVTRVSTPEYDGIKKKELLTPAIRIIDFGEWFQRDNPPAELGIPMSYRAPESFFGHQASEASDVWALGCLVYEIVANKPLLWSFFGGGLSTLQELVATLGPLPKSWQGYTDPWIQAVKPEQIAALFEEPTELRASLESRLAEVQVHLTQTEFAHLVDLLKGALHYEPTSRLTAKQLLEHPWFSAGPS